MKFHMTDKTSIELFFFLVIFSNYIEISFIPSTKRLHEKTSPLTTLKYYQWSCTKLIRNHITSLMNSYAIFSLVDKYNCSSFAYHVLNFTICALSIKIDNH